MVKALAEVATERAEQIAGGGTAATESDFDSAAASGASAGSGEGIALGYSLVSKAAIAVLINGSCFWAVRRSATVD